MSRARHAAALEHPATAAPEAKPRYLCALCGHGFSTASSACGGCAVGVSLCFGESPVIACPRCGHQFPRRSAVVDFVRRCLSHLRRMPPHAS